MASNKFKKGSNAVTYALLVVGIVVLVNVVAAARFTRFDLTESDQYTLSDASKALVSGLGDRLTIKAFISSDLPPQLQTNARYLRDLLSEYATYSGGKVFWEALDPAGDEKVKEEARRMKIGPTQLSVYEQSRASVSEAYLGVAFQYGGKVEAIPFVANIDSLEYDISSTIRRLTTKKMKVGFTSGHGEPSLYQGLQNAEKALKDYETTTVDLTEGKNPIPDDVDVLLMVGPTKPLAEKAKYELDQFLQKGKAVAVLFDGMTLETPRGQFQQGRMPPRIARANVVGLRAQLEYYGVKVNEDLVMDPQNTRVVLPTGDGRRVITNYPAFPVVTNMSKESPITRDVQAFIPIFPSSLELTKAAKEGKDGVKGTVLASSTSNAWRQTGFFLFNPMVQPKPTKETGPFTLAVYLAGNFKSFFSGKKVPEPGPAKPPGEKDTAPTGEVKKSSKAGRLVVFSDADFVKDQYLGLNPANLMLLLNTVDYLAQDESLIAIRAKGQTRRPLELAEEGDLLLAKMANVVGLPLAFIVFGLVRWRLRRASRRRRAEALLEGVAPAASAPAKAPERKADRGEDAAE